jgi:hypothetical protein
MGIKMGYGIFLDRAADHAIYGAFIVVTVIALLPATYQIKCEPPKKA